ncbi:ShlB/FhaC/HecB family hemolysin secretion/activation protein [Dyella choica]|uniref:ShlB/FhaC/HecB family hemolysin secretion/activation protein n=1 Tax=Dyella choica TaxID=1927959 RepID=A0A3S0RIT4_9GAMM|nr:ShlB/FhaC/HecB family hemolysin secretion/activation protein [Dyella choica]RUL72690.1 ShlB/FhaC/HecB family hemolysin secretion/activation protein [Dyella choica]
MNNLPHSVTPRLTLLGLSLAVALFAPPARAQTHITAPQTNSGQLLQQLQQPSQQPPSSNLDLNIQKQKQQHAQDNTRFHVRLIQITGNNLIKTDALQPLVAAGEGHELSLNDLDDLAAKISDYYHDHGYPLAMAYVPAQTLQDGVVRLAVVEARYGKVELQNQSKVGNYPLSATLSPLQSGQPVREYGLERSLLLLSDVPGAIVNSVLRPGETEGSSDLLVSVTDAPRYTGTLGMDDYGNVYTDRVRFSGTFDVNGLFHQGDVLDFSGVSSGTGMSYGHVGYRYLLTGQGTTVGMAVSGLRYKLGNGLADLHAHGTATTQSVNLSQPIIRNTAGNLYAQLEFDHKRLYDDIDVAGIETHRHANSWVLTVAGDQRDRTGITNFNVSATRGRLYLDNFQTLFADYFGARTAGSYVKWNYSVSRLQQLNTTNALYFGYSGQHANKNLDTSEQFYLGGPSSVRGYDVGVLSGAQGNLATVEYRHDFTLGALPGPWQASAFVDSGRVQVYKQPFIPGTNSGRLSSAGVGLHWTAPHDWVIGTSVAKAIGNRPALAGPHVGTATRFWLQVQKGFY